jgi:undecaprenyl diphosphate synthase
VFQQSPSTTASASSTNPTDSESLHDQIDLERLPQHVAVIMDGNGRWAEQRLFPRFQGHRNAVRAVRATVEAAVELGLANLTLYAFSTENWNRPSGEVSALMDLFAEFLIKELETMLKHDVHFRLLGDPSRLPDFVQIPLNQALAATQENRGMRLHLAVNYGGRAELVRAVRLIAAAVQRGELRPEDIDEVVISQHTYTPDTPDPGLIIRTSGEQRVSNFLTWQGVYAEFHFTPVLWPDFNKSDFHRALLDFQNRKRRMGGVTATNTSD